MLSRNLIHVLTGTYCLIAFLLFSSIVGGCGTSDADIGPDPVPDDLISSCYGWPENDFSPTNKAPVMTGLAPGSRAVDFTLKDPSGQTHNLYELLETKPVLLVFGAFT